MHYKNADLKHSELRGVGIALRKIFVSKFIKIIEIRISSLSTSQGSH